MAKERRPVGDYLVYLGVRTAVGLVQALPANCARAMSRMLAALAFQVDRRHREVAKENLRHAFPGQFNDEQLNEKVRKVYRHFIGLVVEIAMLPRKLHVHNWRKYM